MYTIKRLRSFEKSIARLDRSGIKVSLKKKVLQTIHHIASGQKLSESFADHELHGEFAGFRECHVAGDLLLVYKIEKENLILVLVDIGSHSQLFG